jgi:hypothetical protein
VQLLVPNQGVVKVGAHGGDDRHRRGSRRSQQQGNEANDIGGMLGSPFLVDAGRRLPVRLSFRSIQLATDQTDHMRQQLGITGPQLVRLLGDFRFIFCSALIVRARIEGSRQCPADQLADRALRLTRAAARGEPLQLRSRERQSIGNRARIGDKQVQRLRAGRNEKYRHVIDSTDQRCHGLARHPDANEARQRWTRDRDSGYISRREQCITVSEK